MTPKNQIDAAMPPVHVHRSNGASGIVLVCEHASNHIPPQYGNLGLADADLDSHIAWDPGAQGVAECLSELLDAPLVLGGVSRLVYDCNRPPDAAGAMPARSETYDIPGNKALTEGEKSARVRDVYAPFQAAVAETMVAAQATAIITIHSFTPVYLGKSRSVELGVLHDADSRLADAVLACAPKHTALKTERNQPYGPDDGVTHTLKEHGTGRRVHNVMLEVRNDLIATPQEQIDMAQMLAPLLREAITSTKAAKVSL